MITNFFKNSYLNVRKVFKNVNYLNYLSFPKINSCYNTSRKYFNTSKNPFDAEGEDRIKIDAKQHEEIMNTFNQDFEKLLSTNEEDQEKRVRLLSIKLLQFTKSSDVIHLFEEKYIKGLVNTIYGEELSLMVYFFVSLLEKESREGSVNTNKMIVDGRLEKIMTMLHQKLDELDTATMLALSWSLSILISKFNYQLADTFKVSLLKQLPDKLEIDKKGEIPTLCYSISSFLSESNNEMNKLIKDKIENYSSLFFSDAGLNYINPLNLSLLSISWNKIKYVDVDLLDQMANALNEIKESITEDNFEEVCKIIWTFYMLNYKNEKLNEFLEYFLESHINTLHINQAIDLFISYSSLFPENSVVLDQLIEKISQTTNDHEMILDINTFINIWLGVSKYYLKGGKTAFEGISFLLKFLLTNYDKRKYLETRNMTPDEICSLLVSFSVLDLEPNKIYKDLGYSIKGSISKFDNIQLIQLLSCGKYLFNTKIHSDLYFLIHEACEKAKGIFDANQIKTIKRILTRDAIVTESFFLEK